MLSHGDDLQMVCKANQSAGNPYPPGMDELHAQRSERVLVIEKKFCRISEKAYHPEDELGGRLICGLLGIVNIMRHNFLVVITQKKHVARMEGSNINIVIGADLIPFYPADRIAIEQS